MASRSMQTLRSWLSEGPFTLALSAGFFGFYAHCGFAKALYEEGFKPSKITGTSAGAIVGGGLASGLSPEDLQEILFELKRTDFWDPGPGLGLLKGDKFRAIIDRHMVADIEQTHIPFEAVIYDIFGFKSHTLREGSLATAIRTAAALPGLFHPVRIGKRFFCDGGILNKPGITSQEHDERVFCHYLNSKGFLAEFEKRIHIGRLKQNHKVLALANLPRVNPHRLEMGREALNDAYLKTKKALDLPLALSILEA